MSIVDLKKIFKSLSYSDKKELLEILEHSNQIPSERISTNLDFRKASSVLIADVLKI